MDKQIYKLKDKVFIHELKKRGEVVEMVRTPDTYVIEYTIKVDGKVKKIRESFKTEELSPYRKTLKKYNPNEMYWMVREFQTTFNQPAADTPTPLTLERGTDRSVWTGEEALVEFIQKSSNNEEEFLQAFDKLIEGLHKAKEKSLKDDYPTNDVEKIVGQADALADSLYFIFGSFVEMGVQPFNLFKIVQDANMSKLFPDGKPRFREGDNKILKPKSFSHPEPLLEAEVKRQLGQ